MTSWSSTTILMRKGGPLNGDQPNEWRSLSDSMYLSSLFVSQGETREAIRRRTQARDLYQEIHPFHAPPNHRKSTPGLP